MLLTSPLCSFVCPSLRLTEPSWKFVLLQVQQMGECVCGKQLELFMKLFHSYAVAAAAVCQPCYQSDFAHNKYVKIMHASTLHRVSLCMHVCMYAQVKKGGKKKKIACDFFSAELRDSFLRENCLWLKHIWQQRYIVDTAATKNSFAVAVRAGWWNELSVSLLIAATSSREYFFRVLFSLHLLFSSYIFYGSPVCLSVCSFALRPRLYTTTTTTEYSVVLVKQSLRLTNGATASHTTRPITTQYVSLSFFAKGSFPSRPSVWNERVLQPLLLLLLLLLPLYIFRQLSYNVACALHLLLSSFGPPAS